jgi:murein DD-endopeptidase MepM/ murein hydrolase activator NlpD
VPAIGSRAALANTHALRLVGLVVTLVFLASVSAVQPAAVEGKDWRPQIGATRRAQIYWETVMRSADAEIRGLKQARKQTQRKLKGIRANLEAAVDKRAASKRRLKDRRERLAEARAALAAAKRPAPPLPQAAIALEALVEDGETPLAAEEPTEETTDSPPVEADPAAVPAPTTMADARTVKQLERAAKKAKRDFKKARRKARRSARNARAVQQRLRSIEAATRGAVARRESAERNLGAWILAMTRYGRLRATKKSDVRPGVNSSFAWPVRGRISQYYHAGHDGIDIVRYRGAPIRSMAFGVVTYVGWNPWDQHGRAFMVVVTHAGGYETLYGHLQPRRVVRVGEEVRKGQVIGYMGNTGNSTGPHLHLELRRGRTTINPMGVL